MFFSKPKIYKDEAISCALRIAGEVKSLGPEKFLMNAEDIVQDILSNHGIWEASAKQRKQLAQLGLRFHQNEIYLSNHKLDNPILVRLVSEILTAFS